MFTATETNRPKIQIDDEIREMTPEEIETREALIANTPALPSAK